MKQDDLYTLIQKMTKQEKIFFNRYAQVSNNKKNKHYMSLFKLIERQLKKYNTVDEQLLKKKFQYLSVEKRYLMNILIKALTAFHEKDDGFFYVKTLTKQIRVLMDKGIFTEAEKLHAKAVAVAEKYNLFEELLILSNLKMAMADYQGSLNDIDKMRVLIEDKLHRINQLVNYDQYCLLIYQIQDFIRRNGYIDTVEKEQEFNALIDEPLLQNRENALSNRATELYFNAKMFIYELQYDFEEKYKEFQQRIAFMHANPHLYGAYNKIVFTNNYILCCINVKEQEECREHLQRLDEQIAAYPVQSGFIFAFSYMCHLEANSKFGAFESNRVWIAKTEEALITYNDFSPIQQEYICLSLGRACMELEYYEKALDYLYKVSEHKVFAKHSITYLASKLLMLICYYELGWQSNLESAAMSFYRQIRQTDIQFKLYESFLKYLKLGISNKSAYRNKETLEAYYLKWEAFGQDPRERIPFQFFHYKEWLKSKLDNKPLSAYFQ